MAPIQKVALAGATGTVGAPILQALLDANYDVTVLSRPSSTHAFPASVRVATVDYTQPDSLTEAFQGHDALVSAVAIAALDQQKHLVDAAIRAGVKRIVPSNFGGDLANPKSQAMPIERYIKQQVAGTDTTYTFVYNNLFLNWDIPFGAPFLLDVKRKTVELHDGGATKVTTTPVAMVARGVVAALQRADETANREIRIHGIALSKTRLLELAQNVVGKEGWQVTDVETEELERKARVTLQEDPGDVEGWALPFLMSASWGQGYGNDFTGKHDNELLGLTELTEGDVEDLIRKAAQ